MTFEQYWQECLALAYNEKQKFIMTKCKNLYYDYYTEGISPEDAMKEEWG